MGANDLIGVLRARPFIPFRLVMTDGVTYEVRHPDMVLVSTTTAVVGYPDPANPGVALRYDIIALRLIIRLEMPTQPVEAA
jgi:hypothetical protein